ncbi:hypothetical protein ABT147_15735 [Streptomyces sp. NPDC001868]|uniref:hypothetical protein n=1 Tax=Streptomyces sp. NPDC001868 TaxID=3154401 RepID=UPI0033200425
MPPSAGGGYASSIRASTSPGPSSRYVSTPSRRNRSTASEKRTGSRNSRTQNSGSAASASTGFARAETATLRPFDEIGLRTAVLAADHADVVLVEPCLPGASAGHVAETLVHVPHRLLALGDADGLDKHGIAQAVRDFVR